MSELQIFDVRPVLERVAGLKRELILIGGQAVNFWAAYYARRSPTLAARAPFTSKDIDFCGSRAAVRSCATLLNGKARFPSLDDATPNSGVVSFIDRDGVARNLDVVSAPFGIAASDVRDTALDVELCPNTATISSMDASMQRTRCATCST